MTETKAKLNVKPIGQTMTMRADCSACKNKVAESTYEDKHEYELKRKKWQANFEVCPHCKAVYKTEKPQAKPKWNKHYNEYTATATNGTFFVFKWGYGWRWGFRYNGEKEPRITNTGVAFYVEVAKRICEKHKEWL